MASATADAPPQQKPARTQDHLRSAFKGRSHASPIFLRNLCRISLRKASFGIQNAEGPQANCGTGKMLRYLLRNRYLTV